MSHSAMAECFGSGVATTCVSRSGDVWASGYYNGYYSDYYDYHRPKGYGTARISNPATPSQGSSRSSTTPGVTTLMKPSAQSGNAWVVKPQENAGGDVLGTGDSGTGLE
jgi:hypothetical protein